LPAQHILLKFTRPEFRNPRYFFQLDTGQGKTALCYLIALRIVLEKRRKVFIVNKSKDLTFRDYKKAYNAAKDIDVAVAMLDKPQKDLMKLDAGIFFINSETFIQSFGVCDKDA
jgi:hypothetical protein